MTGTAAAAPVTIGSTSGTPSGNICPAMTKCTYVPTPPLLVPSYGTITSFSVNAGSAGGTVWLRVVHFYHGGIQYVSTSPPQTLAAGVNTFNISMGVQAGDQLALDNDSSALMFDTSSPGAGTVYYNPPLPTSGPPPSNAGQGKSGYRLLLSATLQPGCQDPTSAYNQGFNAGFNPGYKSGFNTAFRIAYRHNGAWQVGWKRGFQSAHHSTHAARESTQAAALVALTNARAGALPAQTGCDSVFNQGFNAGFNPGFKSGFNSAFNVAFDNGFKAGLAAGRRHT
jgi:hypothetical protein